MELKFREEAEKIKGLSKVLEELKKTKKLKGKFWEIWGESTRTRELVYLKIDEENQTAAFILNEKISKNERDKIDAKYNIFIGVYYKGCQNNIEPINYRDSYQEIPEKKYSKITHMSGYIVPSNSKYKLKLECISENKKQKLSGYFEFS